MGNYATDKKTMRHYSIKFHNQTDKDVIEYLDRVPNKQAEIKRLIRAEIARTNAAKPFQPETEKEPAHGNKTF